MNTFMAQLKAMDERRKAARISSEELAKEAGIAEATLSRWRQRVHRPTVDVWAGVNQALERLIAKRAQELEELK